MQMLQRFLPPRRSSVGPIESPQEPLGVRLKTYFDEVTACSPMPDRLAQLAAALEAALEGDDNGANALLREVGAKGGCLKIHRLLGRDIDQGEGV
jgi:hypothetical protein